MAPEKIENVLSLYVIWFFVCVIIYDVTRPMPSLSLFLCVFTALHLLHKVLCTVIQKSIALLVLLLLILKQSMHGLKNNHVKLLVANFLIYFHFLSFEKKCSGIYNLYLQKQG